MSGLCMVLRIFGLLMAVIVWGCAGELAGLFAGVGMMLLGIALDPDLEAELEAQP